MAGRRAPAFVLGMFEVGLAVARALGREGILVIGFERAPTGHECRAPGLSSRYFVGKRCPDPLDDPEGLLQLLVSEARAHAEKPVLFFSDDTYIDFVARHRDALEQAFRFGFPPPDVAEALLDKRKQFLLAQRGGMPCPRTFFPESPQDVRAIQHQVDYPAFIKPYLSHLWRQRFRGEVIKGFRVDSPEELIRRFDEVFAIGLPVVVQSVMLGGAANHLKICAYIDKKGNPIATYTGRKLRQYPTQFGNGTLCESAPVPEVAAIGLRFLETIGYRGYANIEMMRDERDGKLKFVELNARPGLHHALLVDAGVNFSLVEYLDVTDQPQRSVGPQRYGMKWWYAADDAKSFLSLHRRGEMSFLAWVRSWAGARSFAVFAWDDPVPILRWYGARAAKALRRRLRRAWTGRGVAGERNDVRNTRNPEAHRGAAEA